MRRGVYREMLTKGEAFTQLHEKYGMTVYPLTERFKRKTPQRLAGTRNLAGTGCFVLRAAKRREEQIPINLRMRGLPSA